MARTGKPRFPQSHAPQIDHEESAARLTAAGYRHYVELIGKHRHIVAKPGDVFHIGSMTVTS
jgi:hypothetical protein